MCSCNNMVFSLDHLPMTILEILSPHPCWEGQSSPSKLCTSLPAVPALHWACSSSAAEQPWSPVSFGHTVTARLLWKSHRHRNQLSFTGSQWWHLFRHWQAIKHVQEHSQNCLSNSFHSTASRTQPSKASISDCYRQGCQAHLPHLPGCDVVSEGSGTDLPVHLSLYGRKAERVLASLQAISPIWDGAGSLQQE